MLAQSLIAASATIMLMLGILHLYATFFGRDLRPQDPMLEARMKEVAPGVSSDATMWKGWIAFNAAAGLGFMLFGVLYGYLAIVQFAVLLQAKILHCLLSLTQPPSPRTGTDDMRQSGVRRAQAKRTPPPRRWYVARSAG